MKDFDYTFDVGRKRFGVSHSTIYRHDGVKYLERWILWFGFTVRLHRFWASDDDRAPHDHPWWFVTFPLSPYWEQVEHGAVINGRAYPNGVSRFVEAFRFHYRPAEYRHIVTLLPGREGKTWTLCISGPYQRSWGFWPKPDKFVPWRQWEAHVQTEGFKGAQ